jgi:hypothetical protein
VDIGVANPNKCSDKVSHAAIAVKQLDMDIIVFAMDQFVVHQIGYKDILN